MSASRRRIGSNLAQVDAHVIQPDEYDEAPEWTEEDFARAEYRIGDKLVRRGRPLADAPKRAVSIRLSPDVLEHFRAGGRGWQTRIDEALRDWIKRHPQRVP